MNRHTAQAEADAADPAIVHETDRWVVRNNIDGTWRYLDDDLTPGSVPAEKPTEADHRRKALDSRIIKAEGLWFQINCYDCGMRLARPIHGHCFE